MQYSFYNTDNQLEEQTFKKNAFKVREHQITQLTKLLLKRKNTNFYNDIKMIIISSSPLKKKKF